MLCVATILINCFSTALLLLDYYMTTALLLLYHCFTTVLLLCCFTAAFLLLFSALLLPYSLYWAGLEAQKAGTETASSNLKIFDDKFKNTLSDVSGI